MVYEVLKYNIVFIGIFMSNRNKRTKRVFKDFGIGKRRRGSTAPQMKVSSTGRLSSNCKFKQRFDDKVKADLFAIMYNNDRALMFSPVESYRCIKHSCWHIGHSYEKKGVLND